MISKVLMIVLVPIYNRQEGQVRTFGAIFQICLDKALWHPPISHNIMANSIIPSSMNEIICLKQVYANAELEIHGT